MYGMTLVRRLSHDNSDHFGIPCFHVSTDRDVSCNVNGGCADVCRLPRPAFGGWGRAAGGGQCRSQIHRLVVNKQFIWFGEDSYAVSELSHICCGIVNNGVEEL